MKRRSFIEKSAHSGNESGNLKAFDQVLFSMNSFAPFGWIGGCVIDALFEEYQIGNIKAHNTLQLHLSRFLDDGKGIIFENPHTVPLDGTYNSNLLRNASLL